MKLAELHTACDRYMGGDPIEVKGGLVPRKRSHEFSEDFVSGLAARVNLTDPANAGFLREYVDARSKGLLRDSHVLEYVRSRRVDENLDSLTFGGASVGN